MRGGEKNSPGSMLLSKISAGSLGNSVVPSDLVPLWNTPLGIYKTLLCLTNLDGALAALMLELKCSEVFA